MVAATTTAGFRTRVGAVTLMVLLIGVLLPGTVLAATPTLNGATVPGGQISVDTSSFSPGTGADTALTGPSIVDAAAGDISLGTIVLTLPGGFAFNTGSGSITRSGTGCDINVSTVPVSMTTTTATATVSTKSSAAKCTISFIGLLVHPTTNALLSDTITASGTSNVSGSAGTLTVVAGAPILSFTASPSGSVGAGANLSPQPVVLAQDRFSHLLSGKVVTLSIKTNTGTPGAALDCGSANQATTNGSGVATYAGCFVDKAGTAYRLHATTSGGVAGDSTADFAITAGSPTKVGFTTQPGNGVPSVSLASQPVATIQDSYGNTVTGSSALVQLTLTSNPGAATLTCNQASNQKNAISGIAAFTGCRVSKVGVGYRITAASSGLTSAVSDLFDVSDRVLFSVQPAGAVAATAFVTQPTVVVSAGVSTTAVDDNATVVTIAIKPNTGAQGATLTCDQPSNQKTVVAGVAAFTGCRIDKVNPLGVPYFLVASATNLSTAESIGLNVVAGPPTKLGFAFQPTSGSASQAFSIQPVVAVQDAGGNTITTGAASASIVTLSLSSNPSAATLTCSGGLVKQAAAGLATFTGCSIDKAGFGYTISATASALTAAVTNPFNVAAPVASISLIPSATVITWGQPVVLTTQFGINGGNKAFSLQATRDGITWSTIASLVTNASGIASFSYRPANNLYYRAVFAGTADLQAGTSLTARIVVRQIAILRPAPGTAYHTVTRGTSVTFETTVRPNRPELPQAVARVLVYQLGATGWTQVLNRLVVVDRATGKAALQVTFNTKGKFYVRSQAVPTTVNANSVWSGLVLYTVV
jgi:hypothetical protein